MNRSNIFVELLDVSYDNITGKLYYYDPRDDDIWPIERFVRELHGKDARIEDYLYVKDVTGKLNRFFGMKPQFKNV